MYTLYKFHFLNGISEINQLFDDILIIWPAPIYIYIFWNFINLLISIIEVKHFQIFQNLVVRYKHTQQEIIL